MMARFKKNKRPQSSGRQSPARDAVTALRVIGGHFRGRRLSQLRRDETRPMKHRVREAIFNLVGVECRGRHAIDLFAGTGAVGLEALSRGAATATFIERHVPTARVVSENTDLLEVGDRTQLFTTSAFLWAKRDLPKLAAKHTESDDTADRWIGEGKPWVVFVCPPYEFYVSENDAMLALIETVLQHAPPGSTLVVEADERLDFDTLPNVWAVEREDVNAAPPSEWDVRSYSPAIVGVLRGPASQPVLNHGPKH